MMPEDDTTTEALSAGEREAAAQGEPPAPPAGTTAAPGEVSPLGTPIPSSPSTPTAPAMAHVDTKPVVEPVERWQVAVGLGLAILGGLSWLFFGFGIRSGNQLLIVLSLLPALWCLAAAWQLRSWWGLAAVTLVYALVAAPLWHALSIDAPTTTFDFVLYVLVPGVIMSAIGTAVGRSRARQAELPPPHGHPAA